MNLLYAIVLGVLLPYIVTAAEVYGIFTDIQLPEQAHVARIVPGTFTAKLKWNLPPGKYSPGDTFRLKLPCVYLLHSNTIYLAAGGVKYGKCDDVTKGPWSTSQSEYSCQLLAPVANNDSVRGTLTFTMGYDVGGATTEASMNCAKYYKPGLNAITFSDGENDLTTIVKFPDSRSSSDEGYLTDQHTYKGRKFVSWTTFDLCPQGFKSIKMEGHITRGKNAIDCPNSHAHAINNWNLWYIPTSKIGMYVDWSCTSSLYTATLKNVPAHSLVTMDLALTNVEGYELVPTIHYTCAGTTKELVATKTWWVYSNDDAKDPEAYGDVISSITKTYTGTITRTTTLLAAETEADRTITVEIDVPASTPTITSTWTGTETTTVTRTASEGGINTVIVEVPTPVTTLTSTWTGTETTTVTQTASEGGTNTAIVEVPTPVTTLTSTWTGTEATTVTRTASEGGTNTVIVVKPTTFSETTLYSTGTGTSEYTITETAASSGGTNTVIVVKPTTFSETTLYSTGTGTSEYTITETAASSGGTNTVIVVKPTTFSETTLFSTGTGTSEYTITETAASSGGTNTVIVVKPTTFSETTLTLTGTGTSEYTITETAASSGGTNTVIVVKPTTFSETILYSTGTGTSEYTITETAASSGGTNTVIVVKPTSLHMTFSLGVYWNTSSTASLYESISTDVITSTDLVFTTTVSGPSITSTVLCEECEQPIFTSEASIASKSSQNAPSGTTGREMSITSVASSNHEEPTCTPCIEDGLPELLSPGRTQSRTRSSSNTSGTRDGSFSTGGSFSKGAQPTVSPDAYFSGSTLSFSSLASTALPSITVFSSQEGAATQSVSLVWALAFGIMLYFV